MIQYGLPSYHWYLKIFWDCCRRKFIDSNLMALRVVITSITTSKVRLTLPSFLLHPQNHFIVYCILYRLEFYTASRDWLPLVNFSQQPKSEKSSQNTDIFFLSIIRHQLSRLEKEGEKPCQVFTTCRCGWYNWYKSRGFYCLITGSEN